MPDDTPQMPIPFGIDEDSGMPLPGIDPDALIAFTASDLGSIVDVSILQKKSDIAAAKADPQKDAHFGTSEASMEKLEEAGWAVLYGPSADKKIRDALEPLLKRRKGQTDVFKIFEGPTGYQKGDTAEAWLGRIKPNPIRPGPVFPKAGVPFYVLIVAPPDEIPFEFQYGLDVFWGVGRLWFSTPQEFRNYAESVCLYETMPAKDLPTSRQMAVFATKHKDDQATTALHDLLATALVQGDAVHVNDPIGSTQKFKLQPFLGNGAGKVKAADKQALADIFSGSIDHGPPAFLFTGGHGMSYPSGTDRQVPRQGALLCQNWPGTGPANPDFYFCGDDLDHLKQVKVHGLVHFLFACYGGGFPEFDNYHYQDQKPARIAPKPMISRLPQALLGREGSALAVLAHVDRAFTASFLDDGQHPQVQSFRGVMAQIMGGKRMGQATDSFNTIWSDVSKDLVDWFGKLDFNKKFKLPEEIAHKWLERDDARNYVLLGDPAVQLRCDTEKGEMPAL